MGTVKPTDSLDELSPITFTEKTPADGSSPMSTVSDCVYLCSCFHWIIRIFWSFYWLARLIPVYDNVFRTLAYAACMSKAELNFSSSARIGSSIERDA